MKPLREGNLHLRSRRGRRAWNAAVTSAVVGIAACLCGAGYRTTNSPIIDRSAHIEQMTKSRAREIIEKALRNTYQDTLTKVYRIHTTEEKAEVYVSLYSDSQTTYRDRHSGNYERGRFVEEREELTLPWKEISSIEAVRGNARLAGYSGVISILLRYRASGPRGELWTKTLNLDLRQHIGVLGIRGKPVVDPNDTILGLEVLRGKQPAGVESQPRTGFRAEQSLFGLIGHSSLQERKAHCGCFFPLVKKTT